MELAERIRQGTEEQAAIFGALGDPTRLKLLKLLCRQGGPHALCVNALAGILGVTQSAVSQHLSVLRATGLVRGVRKGYHVHYFVNREALQRCRDLITAALTMEEPAGEPSCEGCSPDRRE